MKPVSKFKLTYQAKVEMSQERREHLVKSGSADAQKWKTAAVKPVYDSMTVEVEKMKSLNPIVEKAIETVHTTFYPLFWQSSSIQAGSSKIVKFTGERWDNSIKRKNFSDSYTATACRTFTKLVLKI